MKPNFLTLALLLLFAVSGYAQENYSLKGLAVDTAEKKNLLNTSIMVINAKDSVLRSFARAAADGSFAIKNLSPGKFIVVISYPGYADFSEDFTLDDKKTVHDLGKVGMVLKARLLQDVIVKARAVPIKIKGDTTEFNAKAYVIQPNDRVEDLIKQFPGIEVDKDGKITAQGKTVEKVLVDGEEFFGDDPTLVTKNLRADMVDKVQLYDKKSDQATFTGIDDGQKTKTLNIKLKEDKKSGYFGKVDAGIGTRDFYQGQGMFNSFTAKQKFSAYGIAANTGKLGLGWQDRQKYGESNVQVDDNGGINMFFSGDDSGLDSFNGSYDGRGIPRAYTGGLHYDTKWNADKQSLNTNYKIGQLEVTGSSNTLTQNNQPVLDARNVNIGTRQINTDANQTFKNSMFRHKLDFNYTIKLDTSSTLKIFADGTYKNAKTRNDYSTIGRRGQMGIDTLLNTNIRSINNDEQTQMFNASAVYTHKFQKKGRTISATFNTSINDENSKGFLKSTATYYNTGTGAIDSLIEIDQLKSNAIKNQVLSSNIAYTEPLSKKLSLMLNYSINTNNGSANKRSFNKAGDSYTALDTVFSNNFTLNQLSNLVGASLNFKGTKQSFNIGTRVSDVSFKQINEYTGNIFKRHFLNWNPSASYSYNFTQQRTLYLRYYGNTQQPSINQIQPIRVNTDPLNIYLGNQDLTPSFSNGFSLSFYDYKVLSDQFINFSINYDFTSNQIINNTTTDAAGKSTSKSVNLTEKTPNSYNFWGSFGRKTGLWDIYAGINLNGNANNSYSYNNGVLNKGFNANYSAEVSLSKYVKDKYDLSVSAGPSYNISKSTLQMFGNSNGRGFSTRSNASYYLPFKFKISADMEYTYTAPTAVFNSDLRRTLLNANISKSFFKANALKLMLSGNDLLNQNVGFSRNAYGNMITQNTNTTIQRYFMFTVTWDFNHMGGSATAAAPAK
ncbi:MAG: outer membrane beta-barrel family protein [Bacteroidota bacterium]